MKFARLLRDTARDLPELGPLFSIYKSLKKQLKRIETAQGEANHRTEEERFVAAIDDSLQELNDSFMEREETIIINMAQLQGSASRVGSADQSQNVMRCLVNLHGEMLLLLHWSILAYSALVKILKKHFKRTGLRVDSPALQNLLGQPFCSTEVVTSLIHQAEALIQSLTTQHRAPPSSSNISSAPPAPQEGSTGSAPPAAPAAATSAPGPNAAGGGRHAMLQHLSNQLTHIADDVSEDSSRDEEMEGEDVEEGDEVTSSAQEQAPGPLPQGYRQQGSDAEASSGDRRTHPHPQPHPQPQPQAHLQPPPQLPQQAGPSQSLAPSDASNNPLNTQHTSSLLRQTQVALETWSNLVKNASTPSTILQPEAMQNVVANANLHPAAHYQQHGAGSSGGSHQVSPYQQQRGGSVDPSHPASPYQQQRGGSVDRSHPTSPYQQQRGGSVDPSHPASPYQQQRGGSVDRLHPISPYQQQQGGSVDPSHPASPYQQQGGGSDDSSHPTSPYQQQGGGSNGTSHPASPYR